MLVAVVLVAVMLSAPGVAQTGSLRLDEWERLQKYFNGLRDRGLYSLAETVCLRQLDDRSLDLVTRTRYAVELSRTYADHARRATTLDEQSELLERARSVVNDVMESRRNHPQAILLQAQIAFVTVHEIELLRWRYELSPWKKATADRAIELTESVIPRLARLDREAGQLARRRERDVLEEKLKPHQLRFLQRKLRLHLGQVLLDQAKLQPPGSADRADALVKADDVLRSLSAVPSGDRIMWQSQLALVETARLRDRLSAAETMLDAIQADDPPPEFQNDLTAERVELLIAQEKLPDAADALREFHKEHRRTDGRLAYLTALVFLRLSEAAAERDDPELAKDLREEVDVAVQAVAGTGSTYWQKRAMALLADEKSRNDYGTEIGPLVREGRQFFTAGKLEQAAERYATAFETAAASEDHEPAIAAEVGYTYGSLLLKQSRYRQAASVFDRVASLDPQGSRAADADLLRAWCLGMLFRSEPSRERREAYMTALEEHREAYPESPTAAEATWMLARLQERRRQTTQALQLFATIPKGHARYGEALVGMARCSATILDRLERLGKPVQKWEVAVSSLLSRRARVLLEADAPLTARTAEFLVDTSRILLTLQKPDFARADQLLAFLLNHADAGAVTQVSSSDAGQEIPPALVDEAMSLRVVSLSGLGKTAAAAELLETVAGSGPDRLSELLAGLASAARTLKPESRSAIGRLQQQAIRQAGLEPENLEGEELKRLAGPLASAFELSGDDGRAARLLERLLKTRPKDQSLRRRVADLFVKSGEPEEFRHAQQHLRKLESTQKAGSNDWMETRVRLLELHLRLEEFDQAEKLLRVTELLYPAPDDEKLRDRLDQVDSTLKSRDR